MSILDQYQKQAVKGESEQPPDALVGGEYPCEITGFSLSIREGIAGPDAKKPGEPYRFGEGRMSLKVLDGPMKGTMTFINAGSGKGRFPLTVPPASASLDDGFRKVLTFNCHNSTDAIGFAKRFDSSWAKVEKSRPDGTKYATFKGGSLSGELLTTITDNEAASKELAMMVVGCRGLFSLTQGKADSGRGYNNFSRVRALSDANIADWKAKQGAATATPGGGGTSIYDKK